MGCFAINPGLTIVILILLVVVASLGFLYWRYRTSPVVVWKHRLKRHIQSLRIRHDELLDDDDHTNQQIERLADEAFHRYLQTISVDVLADFPNIGPVTIARLQDAGCCFLGDARSRDFETIEGIGATRANTLRRAVKSLVKDARSRFNAGACPEALQYRQRVDEVRAAERRRTEERERELAAVEAALKESLDLTPLAAAVAFYDSLLGQEVAGLTDEVLHRALPAPKLAPLSQSPPASVPVPNPPAIPVPVAVAAKRSLAPAVLPPIPPAPLPPPIVTDLFRAALNTPTNPGEHTTPADHPDLARMRAIIGFGLMVARIDGRLAQSEKKSIRAFVELLFGHDVVLLRNIDPMIESIGKAIPGEATALDAIRSVITTPDVLRLYAWAESIASASGAPNQKERDALARIATALGLQPAATLLASPRSGEGSQTLLPPSHIGKGDGGLGASATDSRAVLEIAPDTPLDVDLIRRRYTMLTEKLDPVRAAAFGPEFAAMADEKRKRIRVAAEALIAPFGEPLEKNPGVDTAGSPKDMRHNPDLDDVFGA